MFAPGVLRLATSSSSNDPAADDEPAEGSYLGTYRLVAGELVNGRPVWRHTSHADAWLAFCGNGWHVQPRSHLGEQRGWPYFLRDVLGASPDLSTAMWLRHTANGWQDCAALHCSAEPSAAKVPHVLVLEGLAPAHSAASYMGKYVLDPPLTPHGKPRWAQPEQPHLVLERRKDGWHAAIAGREMGNLFLGEAHDTPNGTGGVWLAWDPDCAAWLSEPTVRCRQLDPFEALACVVPPPALMLSGEQLPAAVGSALGLYRLQPHLRRAGRHVWRHNEHADRWLVPSTDGWRVTDDSGAFGCECQTGPVPACPPRAHARTHVITHART